MVADGFSQTRLTVDAREKRLRASVRQAYQQDYETYTQATAMGEAMEAMATGEARRVMMAGTARATATATTKTAVLPAKML